MYIVENAIIMAAGMGRRFVPLSYENPKALLEVKGEILIERQIRQLKETGIEDITIVVGYMAEKFDYLKEKYQVDIVLNPNFYRYNNTSSLMCVLDRISSTYICSSDNYFTENVFEKEVPHAYYAAIYGEGKTEEYCLKTAPDGMIKEVTIGGMDSWYMIGHVYFSPEFSEKFKEILVREYEDIETRTHLWEDLYIRYLEELPLYMKKYKKGTILEFDTFEELRAFDSIYTENSGSVIMKIITNCLNCQEKDVTNFVPLSGGLTNKNFCFDYKEKTYVYRYPGEGTEVLINRKNEKISTMLANRIGIDVGLVYFNDNNGTKITEYIRDAQTMTADTLREKENIRKVARILFQLHTCGDDTEVSFNVFEMAAEYESIIFHNHVTLFTDYKEIKKQVLELKERYFSEETVLVPCHNDPLCANWLLGEERMYLIDWEYAGMNHPMWDLADVSLEAEMEKEQERLLLREYFSREVTEEERFLFEIFKVFIDFLWALWGKTRVPYDGEEMEQYAAERYKRLKQNLNKVIGEFDYERK